MADWSQIREWETLGNSEAVLGALQKVPENGARDLYNLGTALLKVSQVGPARAYLEKARFLNLTTHEVPAQFIDTNLLLVREKLSQQIGTAASHEVASNLEQWADSPLSAWILAIAALFAVIGLGYFTKTRRALAVLPGICFIVLALCTQLGRDTVPAYTLKDSVIRSGPGESFLELSRLPAGAPLRVTNEERARPDGTESWLQIRYGKTDLGWLPSAALLRFR